MNFIKWIPLAAMVAWYLVYTIVIKREAHDIWSYVEVIFPLVYVFIIAVVAGGIIALVQNATELKEKIKSTVPFVASLFMLLFLFFYHGTFEEDEEAVFPAKKASCLELRTGAFESDHVLIFRDNTKQIQVEKGRTDSTVYKISWSAPCSYILYDEQGNIFLSAKITGIGVNEHELSIAYGDTTFTSRLRKQAKK